ncbi:hypothetical protein ACSBR2_004448 [Camellia fascicularis]
MILKKRLTRPRDSKPISKYLQTLKAISDELALIDAPLPDDDLVIHILNGVGVEFKDLTADICARENPISFEDLYDKVVDYEAYLKQQENHSEPTVLSTNSTHRTSNNSHRLNCGGCYSHFSQFRPSSNQGPQYNSTRSHHSQNSTNQGLQYNPTQRYNFSQGRGYRGFCQLCDQLGHIAKRCPQASPSSHPAPTIQLLSHLLLNLGLSTLLQPTMSPLTFIICPFTLSMMALVVLSLEMVQIYVSLTLVPPLIKMFYFIYSNSSLDPTQLLLLDP